MNLDQKIRDFILSLDFEKTYYSDDTEDDSNSEDSEIVEFEAISFYRKAAGAGSCDSEDEIDEEYTCREAADAFGYYFSEPFDGTFDSGC